MKKTILLSSILTIIGLVILSTTSTSNASSSLPNDGYAGAPMDNSGRTCTSCHGGSVATQTTGVIFSDIPANGYIGGTTYNFTVTMSGASAYGFELTAQTATSNTGLGSWISGIGSAVSNKYIKQSTKKTGPNATWTFQWIAPLNETTVTFYGAFNYANNNNSSTGDIIKTSSVTYLANTTNINEKDVNETKLSLFPNPTTEVLNITSDELFNQGSIFSMDGKLIKIISEQELISKTISVANLDYGSYFLNIKTKNKTLTAKFIKQN